MRPLELTMEGFKSYARQQTFTFDERSLFAIVGPTGSGKSTILEAMMYALYGKTHREGRETRDLIRTGADGAKVQLSFETGSGAWEVTRVLKRKGASHAVLRKLGDQNPEATGQTAVTARIEELIGLDFGAFCSSVILPQGKFDRFLMATPSERSRILKGIFRLERVDAIRERAKKKAASLADEARILQGALQALPADPTRLATLRARLTEAGDRAEAIRSELTDVTAAERTLDRQQAELEGLRRRADEIERALARVPAAADLDALADVEAERNRVLASAREASARARQAHDQLVVAHEAVRRETGGRDLIAKAREHDVLRRRLDEDLASLESDNATFTVQIGAAEEEERRRASEAEDDALALAESAEEVKELERLHAAHALRAGLLPGSPCPVCEQTVAVVPAPAVPGALESAQNQLVIARAAAQGSATRLRHAKDVLVKTTERVRSTTEAIERARRKLGEAQRNLDVLLGDVEDPQAEIRRREQLLEVAQQREERARRAATQAGEEAARADTHAQEAAKRRRVVAAALTELSGPLGFAAPDIEGDVAGLRATAEAAAAAAGALRRNVDEARVALQVEAGRAREVVAAFRSRFGLQGQASAHDALDEAMRLVGSLGSDIAAVEQAIERAAGIEAAIAAIEVDKGLYDRLGLDMTDHKFTAYLLDTERRILARLGSEKLFELTAGRYRFDDEGMFEIVEARSDAKRPADTLSGGETFLASLALALALAEAVSQSGGRLGCFFLDEGFGSLDVESLVLALDGIETLASPGRLIGLISHVGGLQSELDDLIVLDKAEDGSTVVIQTEGPLSYPAALI